MPHRFYIDAPIQDEFATLAGSEAKHAVNVMRLGVGDDLILFDGEGDEFFARIDRVGRGEVVCAITARSGVNRELPFSLTLCAALPKGDRQKWLVEKAVELGVSRLIPLTTTRGVAQPKPNAIARLERTVIAATKQCGRTRLMEIDQARSLPQLADHPDQIRLLADPSGAPLPLCPPTASRVVIGVGPEGGFTEDELATAISGGWQIWALGPRILRIETAAIAISAWFSLGGR